MFRLLLRLSSNSLLGATFCANDSNRLYILCYLFPPRRLPQLPFTRISAAVEARRGLEIGTGHFQYGEVVLFVNAKVPSTS
jgi:hypothetical protein